MASYYTSESSVPIEPAQGNTLTSPPANSSAYVPVTILMMNDDSTVYIRTHATLIEGVLTVDHGGTGIESLSGGKLIVSSDTGNTLAEADLTIEQLNNLLSDMTKINTDFPELVKSVESSATALATLTGTVNDLSSSVQELGQETTALSTSIGNVQTSVTNLKPRAYKIKVGPSNTWTSIDDSGGKYTTISVSGIKSTDNPFVSVIPSTSNTSSGRVSLDNYNKIGYISTSNDAVSIYCYDDKLTSTIELQLICIG